MNHQTYLVFVYGTLRRHEHNHILLMDVVSVSYQAKTRGVLVDTGWGYPALAAGSEWVFGEVYAVNDDQLARLDRLEGYRGAGANNHYERIRQVVMTDAGEVDAYVYIYTNEMAVGLPIVAHGDWKVARHWKDDHHLYFAYGSMMDDERLLRAHMGEKFQQLLGRGGGIRI